MKMLRKLIGCKMGFRYVAEYVELLPNRQINVYERDIMSSQTEARRTTGFAFEYYDDRFSKWIVVSDSEFYRILNNHKTAKVVRRTKSGEKIKERTLHDIFTLSDHFVERIHQRYVNNEDAIPGVLTYMIDNGYYIEPTEPIIRKELRRNKKYIDRFYIYEHDMRMLWVCKLNTKTAKLELITTYDASNSEWFARWLRKGKLKDQVTMKKFIRSMR